MFESLQTGLESALRTLRGRGKLTEANMQDGLRLVRQTMLEADVSFDAVKAFMDRVTEQALGERVLKSLDPSAQLFHIVYQELVHLMGPVDPQLHLRGEVPIVMLCGLQGSGKTTTCGKLGRLIAQRNKRPLLVAADLQRPAAIDQLETLGGQLDLPVYTDRTSKDPVKVCRDAVRKAKSEFSADMILLDTAGRLHIDQELMQQLEEIDRKCQPEQILLVVDGMTGQDAVNSAQAFNEALELDGVIMTKLDGDARGGAALSVKHVTGVPIKYIGTGEHLEELEEFHPDRMAGRILGQGDMMTLVEKAQQAFDEDEQRQQQELLEKGEFTLEDFRQQLSKITKLGPLQKVMGLIPGMKDMQDAMGEVDPEQDMKRLFGIIDSMTVEERRNPSRMIDQSRRRRIAAGAGVEPHEVNELVKQFDGMANMMKEMAGLGVRDRMKKVREIQRQAMDPRGIQKQKKGTGKRLSSKEKARLRKERERERRRRKRGQRNQNGRK